MDRHSGHPLRQRGRCGPGCLDEPISLWFERLPGMAATTQGQVGRILSSVDRAHDPSRLAALVDPADHYFLVGLAIVPSTHRGRELEKPSGGIVLSCRRAFSHTSIVMFSHE